MLIIKDFRQYFYKIFIYVVPVHFLGVRIISATQKLIAQIELLFLTLLNLL